MNGYISLLTRATPRLVWSQPAVRTMTTNVQIRTRIAFATIALCCSVLIAQDLTAQDRGPTRAGTASEQTRGPSQVLEARELPADQYLRLQRLALSGASVRFGRRIRSPLVDAHGMEFSVTAILDQQRNYLRTHPQRRGRPHGMSRSTARPCAVPVITSVNGRGESVIFTPLQSDNVYRIEGCGFGAESGEVFLVSSSDGTRMIQLQLDQSDAWSDDEIDVRLDPHLEGVPDLSVKLFVQAAGGARLEFQGCRFIARRGEVRSLETIEASQVKLQVTQSSSGPINQLECISPPSNGEEMPHSAEKMSAFIARVDEQRFAGGIDFFDLSGLAEGWVVESIELQFYTMTCPGDVTRTLQSGHWNTSFQAGGFTVAWASNSCSSFIPPIFHFGLSSSEYAVKVWVIGPAGTEPLRN